MNPCAILIGKTLKNQIFSKNSTVRVHNSNILVNTINKVAKSLNFEENNSNF